MMRNRKYLHKKLFPFVAVALAGLYIFSFLLTDLVHPLIHHQEYTTHTAADEQDPCHLEIYHGVKESSANHHTHLSTANDKCWLCDIVFHHDVLRAEKQVITKRSCTSTQKIVFTSSSSLGFIALSTSRGPPTLA